MITTAFVIPDCHFPYHDKKFISITNQIIKHLKPDYVINLGDALDASGISTYLKHPSKRSRLIDEIELYNEQLDVWQSLMKPGSTFHQLSGNHCERLLRYISKNCSDIYEIIPSIPDLLRFKERSKGKVKFKWHELENWESCKIHDVVFHHGVYFDKHLAVTNLTRYPTKFCQGHSHRYAHAADGNIWSVSLGHGSDAKKTAHIPGPNTWQQALGVVTFVCGKGHFEPILVNDGKAVFRGKNFQA